MRMTNFVGKLCTTTGAALLAGAVSAQTAIEDLEIVGAPVNGEMGFQPPATELARDLQWLDGMLLVIITIITLFVTGLMAYVIVRYNRAQILSRRHSHITRRLRSHGPSFRLSFWS